MRYIGYLTIFTFIFCFSCKKEKTETENDSLSTNCIEIETPGQYFPGFPNSWWKYVDQNNDTVTYSISSSYEMCNSKCRPVFLNLDKCISGTGLMHGFYAGLGTYATVVSPIYSLALDSLMICPVSFATFQEQTAFLGQESVRFRRVTTNIDTSMIVNGTNYLNVIEVYEYDKFVPNHRYFDYFAKDIGLIKRDSLDATDTTNHIEILKIYDYFIGN